MTKKTHGMASRNMNGKKVLCTVMSASQKRAMLVNADHSVFGADNTNKYAQAKYDYESRRVQSNNMATAERKEFPLISQRQYPQTGPASSQVSRTGVYMRDKTNDGNNGEYVSEPRQTAVHERLLNIDSNGARPYQRRSHKTTEPINLQLDHIKQNAIKFTCGETEYSAFLSANGITVPHSSNFMEQMRKQQLLQTARQKANKSRKQESRTLAGASSQSTISLHDSGNKNCNIMSDAIKTSQSIEESKSKDRIVGFPNWFGRKNPPGTGLQFKFANFENRLIRYILEK